MLCVPCALSSDFCQRLPACGALLSLSCLGAWLWADTQAPEDVGKDAALLAGSCPQVTCGVWGS